MNEDPVRRRLSDLARIGAEAAYLVGKGHAAYLADTMEGALLRNAGEQVLIRAATVAEKFPADFKAQHAEVDWTGAKRLLDLVADSDSLNHDRSWTALTIRIPRLVTDLGL